MHLHRLSQQDLTTKINDFSWHFILYFSGSENCEEYSSFVQSPYYIFIVYRRPQRSTERITQPGDRHSIANYGAGAVNNCETFFSRGTVIGGQLHVLRLLLEETYFSDMIAQTEEAERKTIMTRLADRQPHFVIIISRHSSIPLPNTANESGRWRRKKKCHSRNPTSCLQA